MSPGAHLSHACRLAGDAQRLLIGSAMHLEASGVDIVDEFEADMAELIDDAGVLAGILQDLVDNYARHEGERLAKAAA